MHTAYDLLTFVFINAHPSRSSRTFSIRTNYYVECMKQRTQLGIIETNQHGMRYFVKKFRKTLKQWMLSTTSTVRAEGTQDMLL